MLYSTTEQCWNSYNKNKYIKGQNFVIFCQATLQWLATYKYFVISTNGRIQWIVITPA